MREPSEGISAQTVQLADELATTLLSIMDSEATGIRSVMEIVTAAVEQAELYRLSRMRDATDAMEAKAPFRPEV